MSRCRENSMGKEDPQVWVETDTWLHWLVRADRRTRRRNNW